MSSTSWFSLSTNKEKHEILTSEKLEPGKAQDSGVKNGFKYYNLII